MDLEILRNMAAKVDHRVFSALYNIGDRVKARFVYLIEYGRECCKWLVKLSNFMDLLAKKF